jgi:hypothetical protein
MENDKAKFKITNSPALRNLAQPDKLKTISEF